MTSHAGVDEGDDSDYAGEQDAVVEGEAEELGLIFGMHLGRGCGHGKPEGAGGAEECRQHAVCAGGGEAVLVEDGKLQGIKHQRRHADQEPVATGLFDFAVLEFEV